jgi:branched-chain amino acid transport system substrate-binding protein
MKTKVLCILMAIGILAFSLSTGFNAYAAKKPIKIGFIADFTSFLTEHGIAGKQGAILAMEQANHMVDGRPVELIIEDEASDPAVAMDKARKLVETDKVAMIIGPFHAGCAGAVSGYVGRVRKPHISMWYGVANSLMAKAKWTWSPFGTVSQVTYPMGVYAYEVLGYRTLTTMGSDYIAGRMFIGGAVDSFKEMGGKIIQQQWVPMGTKDVSPYITVLKKADAVMSWFAGLTVIPGLRQLREYKVKMPVIMPQSGHSIHPKIMAVMGDTVVGVKTSGAYAWTLDTPKNKKWVDAYKKRWGVLPGAVAYGGYSCVQIALAALQKTGGDTSPDAIAKALDATEYKGIIGDFRFGDTRVGVYNYVIVNQAKVDNEIVADVIARCTVETVPVGKTMVHRVVAKSW